MRDYVKYRPRRERMMYKTSGGDYKPYREVWQGLPVAVSDLKKTKGNNIYYCNADGFMLVVPHDIVRACRQNPKAILRVMISRENGIKQVQGIWVFEGTLEDAIDDADFWNKDGVACGRR
jgi:hypothetical protein